MGGVTSAFEFALLTLTTLIVSVDKLDYEDQLEGPEGSAPSALSLFLTETG